MHQSFLRGSALLPLALLILPETIIREEQLSAASIPTQYPRR